MNMSVRIGLERIRNFISLHTGVVTVCKRNTGTGDFDASEEVEFTYEKKPTYEEFTMTDSTENSVTIKHYFFKRTCEATRFVAENLDVTEIEPEVAISEMLEMIPE